MSPTDAQVCREFQQAVLQADFDRVAGLLADDVTLHSPVMPRPYRGRDAVLDLMRALEQALEDFVYVDPTLDATHDDTHRAALFFRARADGAVVHGIDVLTVDDGRIRQIDVYARPLPASMALAKAVGRVRTSVPR